MRITSPSSVTVAPVAPDAPTSPTHLRPLARPSPVIRAAAQAGARVAPAATARALARRFLTPRPIRLDEQERDLLAASDVIRLPFAGKHLVTYAWGDGRVVLLAHGWSSAAGQLTRFVDPLRQAGFRIVALDAPAHGASEGKTTSAFEMAAAIQAVARAAGPLHAVVAHSAGAAACARAVADGLAADRVALVAPWARPEIWVERFAAAFGFSAPMTRRIVCAVEAEVGARLAAVDLQALAPAMTAPTLVVHDRDDALVDVVDVRRAAAALPAGELVETKGLGHSRILRAPHVVERVVRFVAGEGRWPAMVAV